MSALPKPISPVLVTSRTPNNLNSSVVLIFEQRRVIMPRRINYMTAVAFACKLFPKLSLQSNVKFFSDELEICKGQPTEISEESWKDVIMNVNFLTINIVPKGASTNDVESGSSVDSLATLVPQSKRRIRITIRDIRGMQFELKICPKSRVQRIFEECQIRWGIPPSHCHLIYCGRMLHHEEILSEIPIMDGSTIFVRLRLRGGKPVIYLFSPEEKEASVSLSLVPEWKLSAIYPVVPIKPVINGRGQTVVWRVQTRPNGDLTELNTGLDVPYLFWEAHTGESVSCITSPPASPTSDDSSSTSIVEHFKPAAPDLTFSNSVVVSTDNITLYLDKALHSLGLHTEARTSFITYWLPSLLKHKHVALRFLPQTAYERAAPLNVSPKPDVTTRIFMLFKNIRDEELPFWKEAIERASEDVQFWVSIVGVDVGRVHDSSLFRVLEWGGMEVLGVTDLEVEI